MVKCVICNEQFKTGAQISFHKFPKEENRRAQWVDACKINGNTLFSTSVICSKHFKKEDFDYDKEDFSSRIAKLKRDVVPSIFNVNKNLTRKANQTIPTVSTTKSRYFNVNLVSSISDANPVNSISDTSSSNVDTNLNTYNTISIPSNEIPTISTIKSEYFNENLVSSISDTNPVNSISDTSSSNVDMNLNTYNTVSIPSNEIPTISTIKSEYFNENLVSSISDTNPVNSISDTSSSNIDTNLNTYNTISIPSNEIPTISTIKSEYFNENLVSSISDTNPVNGIFDASSSNVDTNLNTNTISTPSNEIATTSNTLQRTPYTGLRENVRFISELQEEHFASPRKRKRNVSFVKTKYEEMRSENRQLKQKCRRLTQRLSSLQDVLNKITNENLLNKN